jgi:apolipoprotein N-acyltransferase
VTLMSTSTLPDPITAAVLPGARRHDAGGIAVSSLKWHTVPRWAYLAMGALALPLASLKWNVAPLAWVAPVPFLLYLRAYAGTRAHRAWLLLALLVGANLMTSKFVTAPVPWMLGPSYGIPIAFVTWLVYIFWSAIRTRAGERWALYAFPALLALAELSAYRLTEVGVWGATANTQVDDLRLLQLASLVGVSGIGFLMAWVASAIALVIATAERRRFRVDLFAMLAALAAVYGFGSLRLHREQPGDTVNVAGIVADLGPTPAGLPGGEAVARNTDELFARSEQAADRGARLVVWNEAATVVQPAEESTFVKRGVEFATRRDVDLVLAYIVPLSATPFRMENKYVWISEQGEILETYHKHHPVPGEGSVRGEAPLRSISRPYGVVAGAICYDYDFPEMSLGHSRAGAGLVVIPASDWRGIDPYHTQMARVRAIEGGFSILRPVRWATSGAFDGYGRQRAAMSHFEQNDRVIMATLPVQPMPTLYARIGDSTAILYGLIILGALASGTWRRGRSAT